MFHIADMFCPNVVVSEGMVPSVRRLLFLRLWFLSTHPRLHKDFRDIEFLGHEFQSRLWLGWRLFPPGCRDMYQTAWAILLIVFRADWFDQAVVTLLGISAL